MENTEAIKMICEHEGCSNTNVRDYIRLDEEIVEGWEDEPIALCKDHAGNRWPIAVNPITGIGDN